MGIIQGSIRRRKKGAIQGLHRALQALCRVMYGVCRVLS